MSAVDASVRFYTSAMTGAPSVSNVWGNLTALLDAVLVDGFYLRTITSMTFADGIVTAHVGTGHDYKQHQVVRIAGATQSQYNGDFRIASVYGNYFTFAINGTPTSPAQTNTALSARVAPLGWEIAYTGDYKRAYRSLSLQSLGNMLRIYDGPKETEYAAGWAKWANVGIVAKNGLADIDTIIGPQAPYDANNPTQNWAQVTTNQYGWYKWYFGKTGGYENYGDGGAGNRNWVIVGDDRMFYLFISNAPGYSWYGRVPYYFGDINSFKAGDQYATVIHADDNYVGVQNNYLSYPGQSGGYGSCVSCDCAGSALLKTYTQVGGYCRSGITSLNTNNSSQVIGRGGIPFPNGPDYSMWLLPTFCRQEDGHMRGMMPGLYWLPHDRPYPDQTVVENVAGLEGKRICMVRSTYAGDGEGAVWSFDLTGPWR